MNPGRIESHLYSDDTTRNKCGAMVKVHCESWEGAETDEFKELCKMIAMRLCSNGSQSWHELSQSDREVAEKLSYVENLIKERITIARVSLMKL